VATTPTPVIGETPPSAALVSAQAKAMMLEKEVVEYTDRLFSQATEDPDYERECRETMRLVDYVYENRQWREGSRFSRNRPVMNKSARHAWELTALLTDLALDFQVSAGTLSGEYSQMQEMLNSLCLHWALKNYFEQRIYDVVLYGILHTGPAKLQWNSSLQGGMGDVQLVPIAPWQWATLGCGNDPQEAECIMYFPVVTKDHLIRRFGKTAMRVECDADFNNSLSGGFNRPSGISKSSWATMGSMLKKRMGVKASAGSDDPYPKAVLKEFWLTDDSRNEGSVTVTVGPADSNGEPLVNWAYRVEPGEMLYPRGRIICTAGGAVLEDAPNPYWHAKKPFPVFRPNRVPWKMSGNSVLKPWVEINNIINKILGGSLDSLYSINEPTLIGPKGALPKADWDALDPGAAGGKIATNNNAPGKLEFAKRAEFPFVAAMQYVDTLSKELDMSSTNSAISQALGKKQVPGEGSIDKILSSRSLPVRVQTRALTDFVEDTGFMGVSNMLQFYTAAHRVAILGQQGLSPSDFRPIYSQFYNQSAGMKPEEFVRKFQFVIKPDSTLATQRDDKVAIAIALQKQGVLSARGMFARLDPGFNFDKNQQELIAEAKIKIALGAVAAAATGKGQSHKK